MRIKKTKIREFEELDYSLIDEPWGSSLASSASIDIPEKYIRTDGQRQAVGDLGGWYAIVLHWVYKLKWNPGHKIPAPSRAVTQLKPLAEVMLAWLNLCEALHTIGYGSDYANAGDWFKSICWEYHNDYLKGVLQETEDTGIWKPEAKRDLAAAISQKRLTNPFDPQRYPAQWQVAEAIIKTKSSHPLIYSSFWTGSQRHKVKGLAAALSALENKRPKASYEIRNGEWITRDRQGREQRLVLTSLQP
jgi:hypothetical protein